MKRFTLFTLVLFLTLISCSTDDESGDLTPQSGLNGAWNLINVTGGFGGGSQDFEKGTIIWDFDESKMEVVVTNNNTITGVDAGFQSGTYPYELSMLDNAEELIVNNNNLGRLVLETNSFIVTAQARDGLKLSFER